MCVAKKLVEICNHCGRNVAYNSGFFINRIPDFNEKETRIDNGLGFPEGDFVCRECDSMPIVNEQEVYGNIDD
jgi:hypothetical protein